MTEEQQVASPLLTALNTYFAEKGGLKCLVNKLGDAEEDEVETGQGTFTLAEVVTALKVINSGLGDFDAIDVFHEIDRNIMAAVEEGDADAV
jgi:hypothetical protein